MKARTREEIISLILKSASAEDGSTQTILMYETYLSHDAIKRYLALLLDQGLLQYIAGEMKFKTTNEGMRYLASSETMAIDSQCNHQCKKCGVQYACGEVASAKCGNPYYHGVCQGCLKVFGMESMRI